MGAEHVVELAASGLGLVVVGGFDPEVRGGVGGLADDGDVGIELLEGLAQACRVAGDLDRGRIGERLA